MTLRKSRYAATLKIPLDRLERCNLFYEDNYISLWEISLEEMAKYLNIAQKGMPKYISLDNKRIIVYPIPDKNYKCEIIGSTLSRQ